LVLLYEGYDVMSVILWHLAMLSIVFINNFLNILLNNKDNLFAIFIGIVLVLAGFQYYGYFDITLYTTPFLKDYSIQNGFFCFL